MPTTIERTEITPVIDRDLIEALYAMYGLPMIGGGSQENDDADAADEQDEECDLPPDLGDKGKAAIAKERQKAKDAAARAKAAEERAAALETKQREADEEKRKADEEEATRKEQFKELAEKRAIDLQNVTGERDGLKTQLDALIASLKPGIDAAFKELPEEVAELFTGDAEDVLAKQAFMASHKKLIDRFAAEKNEKNEAFKRFPRTPQPNGNGVTADDDKARKAQARTVSTI